MSEIGTGGIGKAALVEPGEESLRLEFRKAVDGPEPVFAGMIRAHYRMQLGLFLTESRETKTGVSAHSEVSSVPMWNHSAWLEGTEVEFKEFLRQARVYHQNHCRRPVIYLVRREGIERGIGEALRADGFEKFDEESWMVQGPDEPAAVQVREGWEVRLVETEQGLEEFIRVFCNAYRIKESGYGHALRKGAGGSRARHFVGYDRGTAVAIATLIEQDGDAGLYNIGTVEEARGQGYGRSLTAYVMGWSRRRGHRRLFLQVDSGSGIEGLYGRLGFKREFVRVGFRLRRWFPRDVDGGGEEGAGLRRGSWPGGMSRDGLDVRTEHRDGAQARAVVAYPGGLLTEMKGCGQELGVPLDTMVMAAWGCLLSRYSSEDKVVFGVRFTFESGSERRECLWPLALTLSPEMTAAVWLKELDKMRHWVLTESASVTQPRAGGGVGEGAAVESVIDLRRREERAGARQASLRPLELAFRNEQSGLLEIEYQRHNFNGDSIRRMAGHVFCLLESMARQPQDSISTLNLLTLEERQQILVEWNETGHVYIPNQVIHQLIEAQVERTPESVALVLAGGGGGHGGEEQLTYRQLNRRANRLAHHLRALGVGPEVMVGLCLDRCLDLVVGLLGVMKAGGAYVPLDPDYPKERLIYMLEDTRSAVLLTQQELLGKLPPYEGRILCLDTDPELVPREMEKNPARVGTDESLAYVIYTSGSTGKPKGVLGMHGALANHCMDVKRHWELGPSDHALQFSPLNFDAALEQIFTCLISGARLVMRGRDVWKAREFGQILAAHGLSVMDIPTAYWHQLAQEWSAHPPAYALDRLRLVIVGGEAMMPESLKLWRQTPFKRVRLINAYGPTETTITATTHEVSSLGLELPKRLPIGRPRGGRKLYLLDRFGNPVPVGISGELYIGGEMLARGYLNRPELTNERFVPNPFSDNPGERLYRTGDLARYLPDGTVDFLGRVDQQVKIRGFRIELGEVESVLAEHEGLREAAVTVVESGGIEKRLAAYVVLKEESGPTESDLRRYLRERLPEHMLPSEVIFLESLPLLASGKIDRRALPNPRERRPMRSGAIKGPSDPLQLQLQLVFERVLNRRPIGVDVSFFELGGDSLQALEVIVELERATGRNLPLGTLYQSSSIESLAKRLRQECEGGESSCFVRLQPIGTRPPLYLVHTTPGDVLGYGNLIYHLGVDQPCYGFQSLGLTGAGEAHTRLEEMAAHYIGLLRQFQPEGPYHLGGWCYGGLVAVEMGRQLLAAGQRVGLMALIETMVPMPSLRVYRYYGHRLGCVLRMPPGRWPIYLREKWRYYRRARIDNRMRFKQAMPGAGQEGPEAEQVRKRLAQLEHVYNTNLWALEQYRAGPYPGRVTLFNAAELDPAVIPDAQYGWPGLAGEIEIHRVPGTHDTMLAEPHVRGLAEQLSSCLQRAHRGYTWS